MDKALRFSHMMRRNISHAEIRLSLTFQMTSHRIKSHENCQCLHGLNSPAHGEGAVPPLHSDFSSLHLEPFELAI